VTFALQVAIVGCGRIGRVRAASLRPIDSLIGSTDIVPEAAAALARDFGGRAVESMDELLALGPDVVVIATSHDRLAPLSELALEAGAHVLVEKPAGLGTTEIERLERAADRAGKLVKVGFNHRFHPGLARAAAEVHAGRHGELLHVRGRYGHGGRPGYDREWRARPELSGGGELVDQGMHLLDLVHWLAGPLPLHSALLRTHFWDTLVEDNAALILGGADDRSSPWALLHVSWTEWKNTFSLEIYCRHAKLQIDGLGRSYGPETFRLYRMKPELGPPDLEEVVFPDEDHSWVAEWEHFADAVSGRTDLLGTLADAHYAWSRVEDVYASGPYAGMRQGLVT
jgi:predicted dehydrogenase